MLRRIQKALLRRVHSPEVTSSRFSGLRCVHSPEVTSSRRSTDVSGRPEVPPFCFLFAWRSSSEHEGVRNVEGVQSGGAPPALRQEPCPSSVPHEDLRSQPRGGQVPLLVLRLPAEEDEEGVRRDGLLWSGPREDPAEGEELWHLAALRLPQRHRQHVPRVPGPDHLRGRHTVLPRHGGSPSCPRSLHPDHEGPRNCGQQVSPARDQAVPRLQDQVPAAPPSPAPAAQASLHHQEAEHLLLETLLSLCSQINTSVVQNQWLCDLFTLP